MQMIISSIVGTSKIYPLYLCASLVSTSPSKPIVVDRIPRMSVNGRIRVPFYSLQVMP